MAARARSIELDLPAVPTSAAHARHAVVEMLRGLDVDLWPIELAVGEAVANAALHAYRGRDPGHVHVRAFVDDDGLLTVVVADDGVGMSPNPDSPGLGVGLVLIERVAHQLDIESEREAGTRLIIRLRLFPVV